MSIPKIIHYCWFGRNKFSGLTESCIDSWMSNCPDFKIIEWNEDNFDINANTYVKEAYESKKWAFVSDYVRLYVLYEYGGIYLDTDEELLKPIEKFLNLDAFSCFESAMTVPTGLMGAKRYHKLIKELLEYYDNKHFIKSDGKYDLTPNIVPITDTFIKYGLTKNNNLQTIDVCGDHFTIYPNYFFCPKDSRTGIIQLSDDSYAIHHYDGSWLGETGKKSKRRRALLQNIFGIKIGTAINRVIFRFEQDGLDGVIDKMNMKVKRKK